MSLLDRFHHSPKDSEPVSTARIQVTVDGVRIDLDKYVNDPDAVAVALAQLVADKPLPD